MSKNKNIIISLVFLAAAFVTVMSMSYMGGEINWFAGFKMDSLIAKESISIQTWSFIIIGIGLSISGLAMQSITRNALASSYSLGTISAASLSILLVQYVISPVNWYVRIILTFMVMFGVSLLILSLTLSNKIDNHKIIVIGITISVLISSISYILKFFHNANSEMIGFLSLATISTSWKLFWVTMPIIVLSTLFLLFKAKDIQLFNALPRKYKNLGISQTKIKLYTSIPTILIAISSVLLIGPISFVGIIVPHITKGFFHGFSLRKQMILSIPLSIIILLTANIVWRATFSYGTNINILLGLVTCPLIIFIVLRREDA